MSTLGIHRWTLLGAGLLAFAACSPPPEDPVEPATEAEDDGDPDDDDWECEEAWHPDAMRVDESSWRGSLVIDEGVVDADGVETRAVSGEFVATYTGLMETRSEGLIEATCQRRTVWSGAVVLQAPGATQGCSRCDAGLQIDPESVVDLTDHLTVAADCPPRILGGPRGPGITALFDPERGMLETWSMPLADALDDGVELVRDYSVADRVQWMDDLEPDLVPERIGVIAGLDPSEPVIDGLPVPIEADSPYLVWFTLLRDPTVSPDDSDDLRGSYVLWPVWASLF